MTKTIASPTKQQKALARKLAFQAFQRFRQGDPDVPDYFTGRQSAFIIANGASSDPALGRMPGKPEFKTPQWRRTVK